MDTEGLPKRDFIRFPQSLLQMVPPSEQDHMVEWCQVWPFSEAGEAGPSHDVEGGGHTGAYPKHR